MSVKLNYETTVWIGEHEYKRPPLPKNKKDILFYDQPSEKAFWLRLELPSIFGAFIPNHTELYQESTIFDEKGLAKSYNKQDSDLFVATVEQELKRRQNGVHFRNGNDIEYITGSHYFTLNYCKVFGKDMRFDKFRKIFGDVCTEDYFIKQYAEYGYFYKYQRDLFYLIDKATDDEECLGLYVSKAKKTGVTFLFACYKLNRATLNKQLLCGVMSKKKDDAIDTNMMYLFHAFDSLPNIFKPSIQTFAPASGEVIFGSKTFTGTSASKNALSTMMSDKALNSRIWAVVSKVKAYDSPKISIAELDEFNKLWAESRVSPKEVFETTAPTVKLQNDILGKIFIFGYTSEVTDQGVQEARKIYFDSKLKTKNGSARTKSELWCYHISSLNSYLSLIDKNGDCNSAEANRRIEESLERAKGEPKLYQSILRQLARTERDAWSVGSTSSTFNVKELSDHLVTLQEESSASPTPAGMPFELRWENDIWEIGKKDRRPKGKFCPVKFIPLSDEDIIDGKPVKFTLYQKIPREQENLALRFGQEENGNLTPPARFNMITGIDPTSYADGSELQEPSKNAMICINFGDELLNSRLGHIATKVIVADYYFRPDNPTETYEDMLKWIIYTGTLFLPEGNAAYLATRLAEEGLIPYMVVRDKEKVMCVGKPWFKLGEDCNLIRRTANGEQNDVLETIVRVITHYIEIIEGEANYLVLIKIIKLIEQLISFNPKETRKFDYVMALGYCLIAYEVYYNSLLEQNDDYGNLDFYGAILSSFALE